MHPWANETRLHEGRSPTLIPQSDGTTTEQHRHFSWGARRQVVSDGHCHFLCHTFFLDMTEIWEHILPPSTPHFLWCANQPILDSPEASKTVERIKLPAISVVDQRQGTLVPGFHLQPVCFQNPNLSVVDEVVQIWKSDLSTSANGIVKRHNPTSLLQQSSCFGVQPSASQSVCPAHHCLNDGVSIGPVQRVVAVILGQAGMVVHV